MRVVIVGQNTGLGMALINFKLNQMTEKEAFDNPEMKIILLLSGYVRELSEGADYEDTAYKLAKTIVRLITASKDNNQNEIIKKFIRWNNKHNGIASPVPEAMADRYLERLKDE